MRNIVRNVVVGTLAPLPSWMDVWMYPTRDNGIEIPDA